MRILPLAFLPESEESLRKLTYSTAGLTHGHPVSQLCCAIYVMVARELFFGAKDKETAIEAGFKKGYENISASHYPDIEDVTKTSTSNHLKRLKVMAML